MNEFRIFDHIVYTYIYISILYTYIAYAIHLDTEYFYIPEHIL